VSTKVLVDESTFYSVCWELEAHLRSFVVDSPHRDLNSMPSVDHSCCVLQVKKNGFCVDSDSKHIELLKAYPEVALIHVGADWEERACEFVLRRSNPGLKSERSIESQVKASITLDDWSSVKKHASLVHINRICSFVMIPF